MRFALWLLGGLAATVPHAGTIGVSWNPSVGASGYRVHYGAAPEQLEHVLDVGNVTSVTIAGLEDCASWHFAVSAYNAYGESALSTTVASWPRPSVRQVGPASARQGARLELTLDGSNFHPEAIVEIDNARVLLGPPAITCHRVTTAVLIEPTAAHVRPAQVGNSVVRVRNPQGLVAEATFGIAIEPARFDVNRSAESTDGRLDGWDTVWLARMFGTSPDSPSFDPDYDFDGDGWVDGEELALIGANLGFCWDGSSWSAAACRRP